jgi:hypothetical protein
MNRARNLVLCVVAALLALLPARLSSAQCDDWRAGPLVDIPGVNGRVFCFTTWDPDGAGPLPPQLVVGGNFTTAGGTVVNGIARWDGAAWQPFGAGMTRASTFGGEVGALIVLPASFGAMAGQLVAGGYFDTAGGVAASSIARWTGSAWVPFGAGVQYLHPVETGTVSSMLIAPAGSGALSGHLIISGDLESVDGVSAISVAHWDGSTWAALGSGLPGIVHNITMWDPDGAGPLPSQLVAGGNFFLPDFPDLERLVATWNGSTWVPVSDVPLSTEPNVEQVYALGVIPPGNGPFSGQLIAGGSPFSFTTGPTPTLFRWDGAHWQDFGAVQGSVLGFGAWDPDGSGPLPTQLIAAGDFSSAGGLPISHGIMRYDGTTWQSVGAGFDGPVNAVISWDPDGPGSASAQLVAGGSFQNAASASLNNIGRFDGTSWQKFTQVVANAQVFAFAQLGPRLVGAGSFAFATPSNGTPNNIAAWDGLYVSELGSGLNGAVHALKSFNSGIIGQTTYHVVAGGSFTTAGGAAAAHIAQWNENPIVANPPPGWSALGPGLNNIVFAIERFNNLTIAGGQFTATGDNVTALNHIAQWTGSAWQQLGTGLNGTCNALKLYNGQVYAGGSFTTAGGLTSGGLARWNGSSWSTVGGNFIGTVNALEVFNGELVIGGTYPGISSSPNIAKFNSVTGLYSVLGSGGTDGAVRSLLSENGNLYVGGDFTHAGGVAAAHLARWDGSAWSSVRGGTDNSVYALAGYNNEVHAGGTFVNVRTGAVASAGWARYLETGAPYVVINPSDTSGVCHHEVSFTGRGAAGYSGTATWRHNGVPLADGPTGTGSLIAGAHSGTVDILDIGPADAGTYDFVITNNCGTGASLTAALTVTGCCGSADFNCDGDVGTDADIESFFACIAGTCPPPPCPSTADFNGDGDVGTDADIEAFFSVLAGGVC